MKRIILDLDNTLIDWKDSYWDCVTKAFDALHVAYDKDWLTAFSNAIVKYETECDRYSMEKMLEYINKETNRNLTMEFMRMWEENLGKAVPDKFPVEIKDTLQYLYQKYDLVVLSNWFSFSQVNRLKNAGILQYFSHVYCTEYFKMKPDPEAYIIAKGEYDAKDCVMIGDDIKMDIEGALTMGMEAIFYNRKKIQTHLNCKVIYHFEELKKVL